MINFSWTRVRCPGLTMWPYTRCDSVTSDTWWRRRDGHWARGCGPSIVTAEPGSRPAQQHSGHNISSTNSSAPTTIEQRQSRPGARLVQGARCWWHIGRIQHIWLDNKYEKIIKFQPSWCWKDWSLEWRKVQLRKVRLSSLYFMFAWPTIWTWLVGHEKVHDINSQSAIFTSSTKKEPTFCTSCLLPTSYFIVRMFLLWGISF